MFAKIYPYHLPVKATLSTKIGKDWSGSVYGVRLSLSNIAIKEWEKGAKELDKSRSESSRSDTKTQQDPVDGSGVLGGVEGI